jgi:hypothetical protein
MMQRTRWSDERHFQTYCAAIVHVATLITPTIMRAQPVQATDTSIAVTFGGFVDSYYAYDFNRPASFDRSFTTQPARHNEFNVNLAYVDVRLNADRLRGRIALQAGTAVQSNYAGEPRIGSVSGPDLSRFLQEAFIGYQLAPGLWVDAGIFYSNAGMESWVSRDNLTYTRSLVADYSPYYSAGVKATWQATHAVSVRLDVVNGWQNISESNAAKGVGARIDFTPSSSATMSYYNYLGSEPGSLLRTFNGIGAQARLTKRLRLLAEIDVGTQEKSDTVGGGHSVWHGGTFVARFQATRRVALAVRAERYDDADQVIIPTGSLDGFRASGASLGVDVAPRGRLLWRNELRAYEGSNAVFPRRADARGISKRDAFVVSSLALTF